MGKSASGKDHIYRNLCEDRELSLHPLVSYTTRPMREGEVDGREYYFTDTAHLEKFRQEGRVIEERRYPTVFGDWHYFTADDGQIALSKADYIAIGTLESYRKIKDYFGREKVCPIYIEVEDGLRLMRAIKREQKQKEPAYTEICRRFLADAEDFSEEKLQQAGIAHRFLNNEALEECAAEIRRYLRNTREAETQEQERKGDDSAGGNYGRNDRI